MKTSIFTALIVATSSACAQMPLPLIDNNKPAPVGAQAKKVNIKVDKLMIVADAGELIALAPRKTTAADTAWTCGRSVNFRISTATASMFLPGIAWDWETTAGGQPICAARIQSDRLPFQPKPDLQFSASLQTSEGGRSEPLSLRSACGPDGCQFLPLAAHTPAGPTDKIAAQASALQARIGKLWDATGGKLIGGSDDCNTDYQCQNNDNGTVGESIKPRK